MSLKNKKLLITAGPTWVAIDPVRVITNIASGQTGQIMARLARDKGAKVTLLLGSADKEKSLTGIKVKTFRFFHELKDLIFKEIKSKDYDCIIHNAAVSDFLVRKATKRKIDSGKKSLEIKLSPAPKIINQIRRMAPKSILVMFKLEANVSYPELIRKARLAQSRVGADIVIANMFRQARLKSFIYNHKQLLAKADSRLSLAKAVISVLEDKL